MKLAVSEELARGVHAWACQVSDGQGTQLALERIVLRTLAELAEVTRNQIRGNTTVKVCHPEGKVKKGFVTTDREI